MEQIEQSKQANKANRAYPANRPKKANMKNFNVTSLGHLLSSKKIPHTGDTNSLNRCG